MRKKGLIASCLLFSSIIAGCSCSKSEIDTHANVSYGDEAIYSGKAGVFDTETVYNYIVNNQQEAISKQIMLDAMNSQINLTDSNMKYLYEKYLNEYFKTTFVDNSTYKYNGTFDESLVVDYLRSESYIVSCGTGFNSGYLDDDNFSCDYSDYIRREVDYDIYLKMLKVNYLITKKSDLIDKNKARKVVYYTIAKGSDDNEVREQLESYVADFEKYHDSNDETKIKNIYDVAEAKRKKDLEKIAEEYAYISTSQDSSSGYTYLNKFTNCGDLRCTKENGRTYQDDLIMAKEYYKTEVVVKNNETILYEDARELLFKDDVEDYLYTIGNEKYLMSPAYAEKDSTRVNDIIMYDASGKNYYLATVKVIDSSSSFEDKALVAEILLDKISDSTVLSECIKAAKLNIYDKDIREYFESKYGEIKSE